MSDPESKQNVDPHLSKTLQQEIQGLPVAEKITLAKTGDTGVRTALLKDRDKQVLEALLDNPRITETEIVTIVSSCSSDEGPLSRILNNREWLKNYQVRLGLVNNPRIPIQISVKLVGTLRLPDLKRLAVSKDVAPELAAAAQTVIDRPISQRVEAPKEEKGAQSRYQEIKDLPVADKVKMAMMGDKEARAILLKDSNRQVQAAVLDSPRITETEIIAIVNTRNMSDEILRKVSESRQWMKNYQVRLGLVNNPKTPLPLSLKLVNGLMLVDLKRLAKSKGVSNVLVAAAQRKVTKAGYS